MLSQRGIDPGLDNFDLDGHLTGMVELPRNEYKSNNIMDAARLLIMVHNRKTR